MKRVLAICALALACKREEDAPQITTTAPTAHAQASAAGPTQLVALAQPTESTEAPLTPTPTQTLTPTRTMTLTMGTVTASGLAPDAVQRVVRQAFPKFRACYDAAANPKLRGRVTTRFTVDESGMVTSAQDAGSDLPDATVVMCVAGAYGGLTFPQPEDSAATATVPLLFSPPS
jgi:outer membrane biosynthesis protein TonB